jgi:nucleotide-binding universal stress UspA family protein
MFRNLLLPLDLTDRHGPALSLAAEYAARGGGAITLLHVIEVIPGLSMEEEREFYARLERTARGHLARLGKRLEERKVSWRAEVRYGHRAEESARYAAEAGADLVIVTAPRLDPDNPLRSWGSLSYKIGILSPCPVLLVK